MEVEPPTKAGPHYWRAKVGDEWVIRIVNADDDGELCVLMDDIWLPVESKPAEQWLPIPTADELVESIEAWAVIDPDDNMIVNSVANKPQKAINLHARGKYDTWGKRVTKGYTCEPVAILRKGKQ